MKRISEPLLTVPENLRIQDYELQNDTNTIPIYEEANSLRTKCKHISHADDSMTIAISVFYAKLLIVTGLALPVTSIIRNNIKTTIMADGFTLYLYSGSVLFLCYILFFHYVSEKRIDLKGKHYGSFYLHMGLAGFGVGSVIYSCLQFGEYFDLTGDCRHVIVAIKPIGRIIFTVTQTVFIFSFTNILDPGQGLVLARLGLMHLIATNICEWLNVVIQEASNDLVHVAYGNDNILSSRFTRLVAHDGNEYFCNSTDFIVPVIKMTSPYLRPCGVEYSLLCSIITAAIWKDLCDRKITTNLNRVDQLDETVDIQLYSNSINKSTKQYSVDCANSHKGLFCGIAIFAGTAVSLILFSGLIESKNLALALNEINIWETFVFIVTTSGVILCYIRLREIPLLHTRTSVNVEHTLLLITQSGAFLYYFFKVIATSFMISDLSAYNKASRIAAPLLAIVECALQTLLIIDAWNRRCTGDQVNNKPGRQAITFLIVSNLALWLLNRAKNMRAEFQPIQLKFYGVLAWTLLTNISVPLLVCYRFQAVICLYEIWKNVYKPIKRKNNNGFDEHQELSL